MYSLKRIRAEWIGALLAVILVLLLLGKLKVGEYAEGFYIVRPTHWTATPTEINIELTSFYPANLVCAVKTPESNYTYEVPPRGSILVIVEGSFTPNTYVTIPLTIDCGVVKEKGVVRAFVFT